MNPMDLPPAVIPGYDGGPYTHHPEYLDEPLFWLGHLYSCSESEEAEELLLGPDHHHDGGAFHGRIHDAADWPVFTLSLNAGHRIHVVYRTFADDPGTDYLLHHPDWDEAELLAQDEGHFMGPALSWPELEAVARGGMPGDSTDDPHARLLLLLPALGDDHIPDGASAFVAAALAARTTVSDPARLANVLLAEQGQPGPAHWTTSPDGVRVNDGCYSFRNPANSYALPPHRLARVSAALAP